MYALVSSIPIEIHVMNVFKNFQIFGGLAFP